MLNKLINKSIILTLAVVFSACLVVCAETVETKLIVDESNVLKSSTKDMLGINGNWYSERLFLGGNTSTEISDEYISTVSGLNIPIEFSRMSGADSQYFSWKDSLGTMDERSGGNLGIVEWIKAHKKVNPDVRFTFTINIMEDTIEDHKDLVRFLTLMPDDANAVGSDGVNWAQRRVDLGIYEPVNIKTFELGNEVYYDYVEGCRDNIEVDLEDVSSGVILYVEDCLGIIDAMKSVNDNISFTASCFTYTKKIGEDAKIWNEYLVNNLAGKIDYVAYHEYYYNYNFYWYTMQLNQYLYKYINKLEPSKRPKIYHSEYGYWMSGYDLDELSRGTSLYGTLINAKFLNNIINMPLIEMASIHVTHERISTENFWRTGWDLFRIYDDGKIYCTAPTEMLKIFDKALGGGGEGENVVSASLSGNAYVGGYGNFSDKDNTPVDALTVSAHTTYDGGVNLILVNSAEDVTHNITFEFNSEYRLSEKYVLTSENVNDNNLKGHDDTVYMKSYAVDDFDKLTHYTVGPNSIVVLKCVPLENTEKAENYKIKFYNSKGEENGIEKVNNEFAFSCEFPEGSVLASQGSVYCAVLNKGVTDEEFINGGNNLKNLCWFDRVDVRRNIGYAKVSLPQDLPSGEYTIMLGLLEKDKYITEKIYLDNGTIQKTVQINPNATGGKITAEIQFTGDFKTGDICRITVQKNSYIANIDFIEIPENRNLKYTFDMPYDAMAGEYEFKVLYDIGESKKEFVYEKPEEQIEFSTELTGENGEVVKLSNIKESNSINFKITNKTDSDFIASFLCCAYNIDGKLISVCSDSDKTVSANATDMQVEIPLLKLDRNSEIDIIKVFVWDKINLRPYIGTYYIK